MSKELQIGEYLISTDKERLDVDYIHLYLSTETYWAKNIPLGIVQKSIEGSLCFGVYHDKQQVGFARVITDNATFAYLADVFIDNRYRGKGLGSELMKFIMACDFVKVVRNFLLATRDAHDLYKQFGFEALSEPERVMCIKFFTEY